MNLHVLVIHFPIAFLTLYAVLEIVPLKKITQQPFWFYLKFCLLLFGVIGAGVAILAGHMIEDQFGPQQLTTLHSLINETASGLFGILFVSYAVTWIKNERKEEYLKKWLGPVWEPLVVLSRFIYRIPVRVGLAVIACILIVLGSALGGLIAFGPNLDPFTHFLNTLLISIHFLP